jgi:tetratricopeptide (TPR) repeat protein
MITGRMQRIAVLIVLALSIAAPLPINGASTLHRARSSNDAARAATLYQHAANLLFWRTDLYNEMGMALYNAGDYSRADQYFQLADDHHTLETESQILWGESRLKQGDTPRGTQLLKQASAKPDRPPALLRRLAAIYINYHDYASAEKYLRAYTSEAPADGQAQYQLALIVAARDPLDAIPLFSAASQSAPQIDRSIQIMRVSIATASLHEDRAYQLTVTGRGLASIGEWRLAQSAFDQAARSNPLYADALIWLAESRQQNGINDGALILLDQALNLAPDSAAVHAMRGLYFERREDFEQALIAYQSAAEIEPQNIFWQIAQARIIAAQGNLIEAQTRYDQLTKNFADDPQAWLALAQFCVEYETQVLDLGLFAALQASSLKPRDAIIIHTLGRAYFLTGQLEAAEVTFNEAIALDVDNALYHFSLALTHLQMNDLEKAYPQLIYARDLNPQGAIKAQAKQLLDIYFP